MASEEKTVDPRKVTKYKVSGSFYNPSAKDKTDTFEESVEGEEMTEAGANSAFYQEHSKKYPHYKIASIKKHEDTKADADGATRAAGKKMDAEVLNKVIDAVAGIAGRFADRVDAEMCRMDADPDQISQVAAALNILRDKFQDLNYQRKQVEQQARELEKKKQPAQGLWAAAIKLSQAAGQARDEYNRMVDVAKSLGMKGNNKIGPGETR